MKELTSKETARLKGAFGFNESDIDAANAIIRQFDSKSYYNLGAIMAVISQREMQSAGIRHFPGKVPSGKLRDALNQSYGDPELIRRLPKTEYAFSTPRWMDHAALLKCNGDSKNDCTLLVSPYDFCLEDMKELIQFCDIHGMNAQVAGSIGELYFPGHAIDIWITPRETLDRRRLYKEKK